MTAKKRNQHWVPKFYLNAFAIPETRNQREPRVFALSKWERDTRGEFQVGTKNIASSSYLYSPVDDSGVRDYSFEDRQADLESLLARLWQVLETDCVALVEGYRKALSLFVANLYLRHPRQKLISQYATKRFVRAMEAHLGDEDECETEFIMGGKVVKGRVTREEIAEVHSRGDNEWTRHFTNLIDDNTIQIAKVLHQKRWKMIVSPTSQFVTSDNPVCLSGPKDQALGFTTPGMTVTVPLTPDKLLVITDTPGPDGKYVFAHNVNGDVTSPEAGLNFQIYANAYRYVFGPRSLWSVLEDGVRFSENLIFSDPNSPYYALLSPDGERIRLPRNAPCWCNSGKKYKHCHSQLERDIERNAEKLRNVTHERRDLDIEDNEISS